MELGKELGEKLYVILHPIENYEAISKNPIIGYCVIGGYESKSRLAVYSGSEEEALEKINRDKSLLEPIFGEMSGETDICPRDCWWTC